MIRYNLMYHVRPFGGTIEACTDSADLGQGILIRILLSSDL